MGLTIFQNLAGTLRSTFRLGRTGPTLRQGTEDPIAASVAGANGDIYIKHGTQPGFFQMSNNTWQAVAGNTGSTGTTPTTTRTAITVSDYIVSQNDYYLGVSRNNSVNLYLPVGSDSKTYIIKDEGGFASEAKPITVTPASGQKIEGLDTYQIIAPRGSVTIVFGGNGWHVV